MKDQSHFISLWDHDDVSRLQLYILLCQVALNHFFVIKRMLHLFPIFGPQDINVLHLSELRESPSTRKRLQYSHIRQKRDRARAGDFTSEIDTTTIDLGNGNRDLRVV